MAMVANNPTKAKELGVPQAVGQEFVQADKGMKFGKGAPKNRPDLQKINKPETRHGKSEFFKKGGDTMASKMDPKMMAMMMARKRAATPMAPAAPAAPAAPMMKKGGTTKKMATGGSVDVGNSTKMGKVRTDQGNKDGIAQRGKTKGKQVVMSGNKGMKKGGMAC